ncbi:membrane protein insertion efficiency factor YidD [Candidatus Gracilibacteria bacterium]|nr:membrane protein insertion efficiency factor YidD [Candidatus Gracilibacteria bacterium]
MNICQKSIIRAVRLYQKTLSPDHSFWARGLDHTPYCRHIPSCSDYMIEAVEKKGAIIGTAKGIARITRCNPWSQGGYDPVDKK